MENSIIITLFTMIFIGISLADWWMFSKMYKRNNTIDTNTTIIEFIAIMQTLFTIYMLHITPIK
jgi:hypothetical protein